jgi:hypothetical protein
MKDLSRRPPAAAAAARAESPGGHRADAAEAADDCRLEQPVERSGQRAELGVRCTSLGVAFGPAGGRRIGWSEHENEFSAKLVESTAGP